MVKTLGLAMQKNPFLVNERNANDHAGENSNVEKLAGVGRKAPGGIRTDEVSETMAHLQHVEVLRLHIHRLWRSVSLKHPLA